jgi:hypothetical protein
MPDNTPRGDRRALSLRLPESLHDHLKAISGKEDVPMAQILVVMLASASGWRGTGEPTPEEMRKVAKSLKRLADDRAASEGPTFA